MTNLSYGWTPLKDPEQKNDVIEHLNDSHAEDIRDIAQIFSPYNHISSAKILDLFEEGLLLISKEIKNPYTIAYQCQGNIKEKITFLLYESKIKSGKPFLGNTVHYFKILDNQVINKNFTRLTVQSKIGFPINQIGYFYYLSLTTLHKIPDNTNTNDHSKNHISSLEINTLRELPPEQRNKVIASYYSGNRYYTLRKSFKSSDHIPFNDLGWIDVFLHGNTDGSLWAKSLSPGNIIKSNTEKPEKLEHIQQGRALLLADETALPCLVDCLEQWKNPIPPIVISITSEEESQHYLNKDIIPQGTTLHRVIQPVKKQALTIIDNIIPNIHSVDCAWGALESTEAKKIKMAIKNKFSLESSNNKVKGYWIDKAP